jgi:alkaline phosphatase D
MPVQPVGVEWKLADNASMRGVVRAGRALALPRLAHSVHVELDGLEPDREYFYQFKYRGDVSPVGRTRTAPLPGTQLNSFAFAFASCQAWEDGYYPAYRHLAEEDLDVVVHLGDYVYEGPIDAGGGYRDRWVPPVARPAPHGLRQWRARYALYKSDQNLQRAHARFPWMVTWDDHEVVNDYAADQSQYTGDISTLRANAYQAFYEHQPLRVRSIPRGEHVRLHRRVGFGNLAKFHVIDGRQHRDVPPCRWGEASACEAAYDPSISMLGRAQERRLYQGLQNFDRAGSPTVATEFVGTSISTNGDIPVYGPYYGPMIKFNPHIKFFDGDRRGYVRCTVTPDQWRTDLRMVRTVSRPDAASYTLASFVVEDGRPGAQRV